MTAKNKLTIGALSDREIVIKRSFDASRENVFEAITTPKFICRWLLGPPGWTMPICDVDLRVGGSFKYVWKRQSNGDEMVMKGTYREIIAPERIVNTEVFEDDWTGGEALSTAVLTEARGRTTLITTVLYSTNEARDMVLKSPMEQGLFESYNRLELALSEVNQENQTHDLHN